MRNIIKNFINSESGAITVDFVVLTGMVAGLGLAVAALVLPNLKPVASGVQPVLEEASGLGASLITGN
jgi:Flp pilus assembly pilin Flp